MEEKPKPVRVKQGVIWSVQLDVECPCCGEVFDYSKSNDWSDGGFEQMPEIGEAVRDVTTTCEHCNKEIIFSVDEGFF